MSGGTITRRAALLALLSALALLVGCGGGGGGGGGNGNVTVTGKVLLVTGNAPISGATVAISGHSGQTAADGTFTLTGVPKSASTATVTATGHPARTLSIALAPDANNNASLGTIYISDTGYTAVATGKVVTSVNGQLQSVGGATVTIAGTSTTSATDGSFTISNLPVGLGDDPTVPIGTITAQNYLAKDIFVQIPLAASPPNNDLGAIPLGAQISGNTPTLPYTITGRVLKNNQPVPGDAVAIALNGTTIGSPVTTDANGNFFFWVVPGTYTLIATIPGTNSEKSQSVTLTSADKPVTQNIVLQ